MPIVKPISGHTGCRGIFRYLTKDGRSLATDALNLEWQPGRPGAFRDWAEEMDFTRAAYGNDTPWHGRPARTFKHYVLSPDPRDAVTLEAMRELACAWARESFDGFQVAIVYHDDGESGVMHAHVVVNNTHLETGLRLQDPDPRALKRSAQRLAQERGMRFLADEQKDETARVAFGGPRRPLETAHFRRAERELVGKGEYSWVADLRNRVTIARRIAADERDFASALRELGVEVSDASTKGGRRADWLYSMADHGTWRVRGESLGTSYGKASVQAELALRSAPDRADAIREAARAAVALEDTAELGRLAEALEVGARYNVHCMADFARAVRQAGESGDPSDVERLERARDYASGKGLYPEQRPKTTRRARARVDEAAMPKSAQIVPEPPRQAEPARAMAREMER